MMPGAPTMPGMPLYPPAVMDIFSRLVYLRSHHNTFLSADKNKSTITLAPHTKLWEEWLIVPVGPSEVCLRSVWGTYLRARSNGDIDQAEERKEFETWTLESIAGQFAFRSHHNTYLRANPKNTMDQAPHCKDWEHWTIVPR